MKIQYLQNQIFESKQIIGKIYRDLDSLQHRVGDNIKNPERDYEFWKLNKELDLERKILDFFDKEFNDLINELTQ